MALQAVTLSQLRLSPLNLQRVKLAAAGIEAA